MNQAAKICVMFAVSMTVVLASSRDVEARRFSRRSRGYSLSGMQQIARNGDREAAGIRTLQATYHYDPAMADEVAFTDRLRVFINVRDTEVLNTSEPVVAEVQLTDLSHDSETHVKYCPVWFHPTSDQERLGVLEIANEPGIEPVVEPAKVYRLQVKLHRQSATYGADTAFGNVALPYYAATADDTRLGRARQHIAMRTFKEYYYAQNGWDSGENYPMDCYAYYMWATGTSTVGAQNQRTNLGRLFGSFQSGSEIDSLAQQGAILGDYVRMSGHTFMLLAYDSDSGQVWTMEGNFNSTIAILTRSVDSGWSVGHLLDEHVDPDLFQVSRINFTDIADISSP